MARLPNPWIAAAWVAGIAVAWAALVALVGIGTFSSLVVSSGLHLPVLLPFSYSGAPVVEAAAVVAAFLVAFVCVGVLGAPRIGWLGVPIGHVVLLAIEWGVAVPALATRYVPHWILIFGAPPLSWVTRAGAIEGFIRSDVLVVVVCAVGALVGAYVGGAVGSRLWGRALAQQGLPTVSAPAR